MYIDNGWYGGRYILSKYCKTKEYTAFASVQHGHNIVNEKNLGKRTISMTPWLVWNNKISKKCHQNNILNVIPIGSIFIYLDKIYKVKIKKPKGTLVFPLLSHPEEESKINFKKLIKYLKKNYPPPYTISVSVQDLKFLDQNLKRLPNVSFISWGYRGDKKYLFRLKKKIEKSEKIVCAYPGSPLIYSLYLKKKVYLLKNFFLDVQNNSKKLKETKKNSIKNLKDLKSYGLDIKNLNNKKNFIISKNILGEKYVKEPLELIKLLGWDNKYKKVLAIMFSKLIDLKEDFKFGYNFSKKRRLGLDFVWKKK